MFGGLRNNGAGGKRKKRGRRDVRGEKRARTEDDNSDWKKGIKREELTSVKFTQYYQAQNIAPAEEWNEYQEALRDPLPTTFRVQRVGGFEKNISRRLEENDFKLEPIEVDGKKVDPPSRLPWDPDQMGWYLNLDKKQLRSRPEYASFRKFLVEETDKGNINRQEAVSMIPPMLLDVEPHHMVIDMCAAPGSKTAQILEALHKGQMGDTAGEVNKQPTGMVVANEPELSRAHLLVHQLKRLGSANYLVTAHEGQFFPNLYVKGEDGKTSKDDVLKFDRILCDVPCSGDGTMRKSPNLWAAWSTTIGNGLHPLQLQIALRAARMLKEGGQMVYSTCSFNPIENEAVVAELLRQGQGALELVDSTDKLPGLPRAPGLHTWKVCDQDKDWFASFGDVPERKQSRVRASFFPPTEEEVKQFHLERCLRLLPHKANTGGFFVAVLRSTGKPFPHGPDPVNTAESAADASSSTASVATASTEDKKETPAVPETEQKSDSPATPAQQEGKETGKGKKGKKNKKQEEQVRWWSQDDPFEPLNNETWTGIRDFYGFSADFKAENFFQRSDISKKVYFLVPAIARVVLKSVNARLRVVHTGLRVFEWNQSSRSDIFPCRYRLVQEGLHLVQPYVTKQIIRPDLHEFLHILKCDSVRVVDLSPKLQKELESLAHGCVLMVLDPTESAGNTKVPVGISLWRTAHSLNLQVTKVEVASYLNMLGYMVPLPKEPLEFKQTSALAPGEKASVKFSKANREAAAAEAADVPVDEESDNEAPGAPQEAKQA